jgi:uncharacterized protein YjiS (DUF1127 family)
MAYVTTHNAAQHGQGRITRMMQAVRTGWVRMGVYRRTLRELNGLSDRDLDDLGISRQMIKRIALEAAYNS